MDSNNRREPSQTEQPPMDGAGGDWRAQLQANSRQMIVSKIMDTLKRHLPLSSHEGDQELKKVAMRFEERIYHEANSQSDYLRRISLKMLTMESKSNAPGPIPNAIPSSSPTLSRNSQDRVSMDSNNWQQPSQKEQPSMDGAGGDWRAQLQADSRQRIVSKIMDTLKRHLPFSSHEGDQELKKVAMRFEEKIYHAANSQSDYLRAISLKMLTMESKSNAPGPIANAIPSNSPSMSRNSQDPDLNA